MDKEQILNNATGLLEDCLHNGDKSAEVLYTWFMEERDLIERTISEVKEFNNHA